MTSYLSNLLTTTTSRYNSIRKALLSDETDGDTEDDSHVSRVLRAYYTEKGRPFPPWLPPDPNAPQPAAPAAFVSGRANTPIAGGGGGAGGRSGGLSDLWDSSPAQSQRQAAPQSLRAGGGRNLQPRGGGGGIVDSYSQESSQSSQGRPLPSQRAGSYQSSYSQDGRLAAAPSPPLSGGSTAQERLKARLWGGSRNPSPTPSASSTQNSSPNLSYSQNEFRAPSDRGSNSQSSRDDRGGYSSGGGPYSGSQGYDGAPAQYGQRPSSGRERVGLPGGPRGLPSGPRLR